MSTKYLYRVHRYVTVRVASTIITAETPLEAFRTFEENFDGHILDRNKEHCPPGIEYVEFAEEGQGASIDLYQAGNPLPIGCAVYEQFEERKLLQDAFPEVVDGPAEPAQ